MTEFLMTPALGKPVWMWATFLSIVAALLALDLGVMHRKQREIGVRDSLVLSGIYIALGLAFGGWVWAEFGRQSGYEYLTGFVVEKSLAIDNVFVIAMIFGYFAVPRAYQHRVLFWGVLGVILLRGVMIGLGATLVHQFSWILYVFALFLVLTGLRMLKGGGHAGKVAESPVLKFLCRRLRVADQLDGTRFFVRRTHPESGRPALYVTPLFLALVMIETADVIFAVDSVPAIFSITTDPYIVYTSNIFAVLGLRALYFALAAVLERFAYLKQALAVLLVFIGGKIFVADLLGLEKFPPLWSLAITFAILGSGVAYSLWRTRRDQPDGSEGATFRLAAEARR